MYLVTGSNGQLGQAIKALNPRNTIFATRNELNICNELAVRDFIQNNNIDTIINCAAYTAVDKAEDEEDLAYLINHIGPSYLAKTGCKMIHVSTDYVFDGFTYKPYTTQDKPNPLSMYGKTKLAGEWDVLNYCKAAVVIRTSWLYSEYGNNFFKTMLKLGKERPDLNVVYDQIGTPTYAIDLARAILQIVPQINETNRGIYHFSNEGVTSWYDFAVEIMHEAKLNCNVHPILSKDYPTKAIRPHYSVLDKSKIKSIFGVAIRHWKEGLEECLGRLSNT